MTHFNRNERKGLIISVEGIDGLGKTTLCNNIKKYIDKKIEGIVNNNPIHWFTNESEAIKSLSHKPEHCNILKEKRYDDCHTYFSLHERVAISDPNIQVVRRYMKRLECIYTNDVIDVQKERKIFIYDRFIDSTRAYQGHGFGASMELIDQCEHRYVRDIGITPDLTFVIYKTNFERDFGLWFDRVSKYSPESFEIMRGRNDSAMDMWLAINDGFKEIAYKEDRFVLISGSLNEEEMIGVAKLAIDEKLKQKGI